MKKIILLIISFISAISIVGINKAEAHQKTFFEKTEKEFCIDEFYNSLFFAPEFIDDLSFVCNSYWEEERKILIKDFEYLYEQQELNFKKQEQEHKSLEELVEFHY